MICGVTINEFWDITPGELNFVVEANNEKEKNRLKTDITVAYYNAIFQRSKTMPRLENVLKDLDGKKEKSDNDMFDMVQKLHKQLGGE